MSNAAIIGPNRADALILELQVNMEQDGSMLIVEKSSGRPVQFVGPLSCARWEFAYDEATGRNAVRATLENVPVISPFARA